MALTWIPTVRKRATLEALNFLTRAAGPLFGLRSRFTTERDAIERILIVERGNIGDIVLLLPFLTQLRALFRSQLLVGDEQQLLDLISQSPCFGSSRVGRHRNAEAPKRSRIVPAEQHLYLELLCAQGLCQGEDRFMRFPHSSGAIPAGLRIAVGCELR
jgi:hypothetical protein